MQSAMLGLCPDQLELPESHVLAAGVGALSVVAHVLVSQQGLTIPMALLTCLPESALSEQTICCV